MPFFYGCSPFLEVGRAGLGFWFFLFYALLLTSLLFDSNARRAGWGVAFLLVGMPVWNIGGG